VTFGYLAAVAFRTGGRLEELGGSDATNTLLLAATIGGVQVFGNVVFDVYWRDWGVAALEDIVAVAKATLLGFATLIVFNLVTNTRYVPTGAAIAGMSFVFVAEVAIRLRPRWPQIIRAALGRNSQGERLIVVGAGSVGRLLASDIAYARRDQRIVSFVDDDPAKQGSYIRSIRVDGDVDDLPGLIEQHSPSLVVIAVAQPNGPLIHRVLAACEGTEVRVRRVSGFSLGRTDTSALREIAIEELLARDPVELDTPEARDYLRGRTILVTGAAGSIGSELCRQLARFEPARLLMLDNNESGLHAVGTRLPGAELLLQDIRDRPGLWHTINRSRPDVVFHAAAYKHVPILERSPQAGISANVIGTANLLACCAAMNVQNLVFISTDKAVEPSSVLGYTKRFGELLTLATARAANLHYAVVRFGNVLGSSGSAVPVFSDQIDRGGPITVTDPEATRYFMTIREAAGLVIEAGAVAEPADLMVLDMGAPVSILDLAQRMVRLRGLRVPTDIGIEFIGLRPGEKLHEQLFFPFERSEPTRHSRVLRVRSDDTDIPLAALQETLDRIARFMTEQDVDSALSAVRNAIDDPQVASNLTKTDGI